jgi:hypothetical protein
VSTDTSAETALDGNTIRSARGQVIFCLFQVPNIPATSLVEMCRTLYLVSRIPVSVVVYLMTPEASDCAETSGTNNELGSI